MTPQNASNTLNSTTSFSFTSPSSSQQASNTSADALPLRDNGLSFAALAKSADSSSDAKSPFKIESDLSFASLAQSTKTFTTTAKPDSKLGFFGLSNANSFSNFQRNPSNDSKEQNANESRDDNSVDDANYDPHYDPIIPLPDEIVVRTGEEDEEKLFGERGKLYRYDATNKEWKERGNIK